MKRISILLAVYLVLNTSAFAEDITVNVIVHMPNPEQENAIKYLNVKELKPIETVQERLEKEELKAEISRLPDLSDAVMEAAVQSQKDIVNQIKQEADQKTKNTLQLKNANK
jgi:hypothetical protein